MKGKNNNAPSGVELPQGLSQRLGQQPAAMEAYVHMSDAEKASMVQYIQGSQTGQEAKQRIAGCLQSLGEHGSWH